MFKKSFKKSNSKKNNKSFKKYLGGNNNIRAKILNLKEILADNIDKIEEITQKLDNIIINKPSQKNRDNVRDLKKIISKIEKDLKEYNTKIKELEQNLSSNKEIIGDLNKSIQKLNNINSKLNKITTELDKGLTYEVIEYIKGELNLIGSMIKFLFKNAVRLMIAAILAMGIYKTSSTTKTYVDTFNQIYHDKLAAKTAPETLP